MARSVKSPDATDTSVGEKIRSQRLLRHLSQTELGKKVGITFQQIQKYEKGANRVGAGRLQRIAEVLNVPVSFFFEGARGSSPEADNINEGLEFLDTAAAVRVVRAFAAIKDQKIRQTIVTLLEELAEQRRPHGKKRS
jgi:transcriptional regulator with XRE-family HTH domain